MEHSRCEVKELVANGSLFVFDWYSLEFIAILAGKFSVGELVDRLMHNRVDTLSDSEQHVEHQVPVVIAEMHK